MIYSKICQLEYFDTKNNIDNKFYLLTHNQKTLDVRLIVYKVKIFITILLFINNYIIFETQWVLAMSVAGISSKDDCLQIYYYYLYI